MVILVQEKSVSVVGLHFNLFAVFKSMFNAKVEQTLQLYDLRKEFSATKALLLRSVTLLALKLLQI